MQGSEHEGNARRGGRGEPRSRASDDAAAEERQRGRPGRADDPGSTDRSRARDAVREDAARDDSAGDDAAEPEHPDEQAELAERSDGAHAEQVTDEANFRADPDPPGVDRRGSS